MCVIMPSLVKKISAEGKYVFLVNLVHLHVLQYFFSVAKEFLAVGTRLSLSSSDSLFSSTSQFHVLHQFCMIVHFLADSTLIVLCFLVGGQQFCFKQVIHLADVHLFQIIILCSLSIIFYTKSLLQEFDKNVLLGEVDNKIKLNCCLKKNWVPILKWIKHLHTVTLNIQNCFCMFISEI